MQTPAGNRQCFACGRFGHITRDCHPQGNQWAQGPSYQQQGNDQGMSVWGNMGQLGGENGDAARLWVISVPCAGGIHTTKCKHNQDQANTMLGTRNNLRGETEAGGPHLSSGTGG